MDTSVQVKRVKQGEDARRQAEALIESVGADWYEAHAQGD
jgi:hypothetical protein